MWNKMYATNIFGFFILSTFVAVGYGFSFSEFRSKRQTIPMKMATPTAEECMKPPMKRFAYECCQLPKEKIWGDISDSLNKCFARRRIMRQQMAKQEANINNNPNMEQMTQPPPGRIGRPLPRRDVPENRRPWRKTHIFRRRQSDACFMECVFEEQGFLLEKKVNKQALLNRLQKTLGNNQEWHRVAVQAVETCHATDFSQIPNNSTCVSRSEDMFRCIFKQIFFNCPTWPIRNEYCTTLKDFYQKCPNGPPPDMEDSHPTVAPEGESEGEADPEAEPEEEPEAETETQTETAAGTEATNENASVESS